MPEKKRVYTPSRGYDIQLKIKELDYTNDMRSVRIVSAINTAYQIVTLDISLDPNDVILDDVMGKVPMKLSIKLLGQQIDNLPLEDIQMELQYVKSNTAAISKPQQSEGTSKDRVIFSMICIPSKPFKTMTTLINDVFIEKTPKQIINEMASKYTNAEVVYDTDDENINNIEQVILPPTTLYKTIQYLDDNFGLFDGGSNLGFCQYDNKIYIQNLTKRMTKKQTFTIYQLAEDDHDTKKIVDQSTDGKTFYTYMPLITQYSGTTKFMTAAKKVRHIVKPKDSLFRTIDQNLDDVCLKFGAIFKQSEMVVDPNLNDRETYNISHSGNDDSDIFANAKMAREILMLATVELDIERSLPILTLMNVGEPVKLKCKTVEYIPLGGKYILKASDLNFSRDTAEWSSTCHIILARTNQYI